MPCRDGREGWDHAHSEELVKLLENIIEVLKRRQSYSPNILPFQELSHEATRTLCSYLTDKDYTKMENYSKQLQHWWVDHQDWDRNRDES